MACIKNNTELGGPKTPRGQQSKRICTRGSNGEAEAGRQSVGYDEAAVLFSWRSDGGGGGGVRPSWSTGRYTRNLMRALRLDAEIASDRLLTGPPR